MKIIIKMNDDSNQEGDFLPRSPYIVGGGQSRNNSEQFRMGEEQKEEVDFEERDN